MLLAHSKLGASNMERWSNCPGSVRLCEGVNEEPSIYAKEGTKAHDLAAKFFKGELPADDFWKIPDEMRDAIKMYHDIVSDDYWTDAVPQKNGALLHNNQMLIEHRFDLESVYTGCFGTADAIVWIPTKRLLLVYDFKYGAGHLVEAENNLQMMYYALGALNTLNFNAKEVECVIVQPRCQSKKGTVRRWRAPAVTFLDFEADLVEAARRTEDPNAPLVIGRYCFFCPARNFCPARHEQRIATAQREFSEVDDDLFS